MRKFVQKAPIHNAFVGGLCKLFDGTIEVLSCGILYSSLYMRYVTWHHKRRIARMIAKENGGVAQKRTS